MASSITSIVFSLVVVDLSQRHLRLSDGYGAEEGCEGQPDGSNTHHPQESIEQSLFLHLLFLLRQFSGFGKDNNKQVEKESAPIL